ncbi:MAG: acyloxyacyl hydrolase [Armatimonadetes bacterium]|nr:hypothetical protein [Armatimonadota bacterium]MBS1703694.1 acyloxyacyl hydrolase [Armatimonadota bacterium]MBS1726063.1 acyloxyacyl hydrolase [Armatimonadota bacterium]
MRGLIFGGAACLLAPSTFAQALDDQFHYYTYGNVAHSLLILGSSDSRTGGGLSMAVGRLDPKLRLFRHVDGELIWEGYYLVTNGKSNTQFPAETTEAWGALATARYRWTVRRGISFYGDLGFGVQFVDHVTKDLRLANNTTPVFGIGLEFSYANKTALLLGGRVLHASNAGRTSPNPGQNMLQWYIGFRYQH